MLLGPVHHADLSLLYAVYSIREWTDSFFTPSGRALRALASSHVKGRVGPRLLNRVERLSRSDMMGVRSSHYIYVSQSVTMKYGLYAQITLGPSATELSSPLAGPGTHSLISGPPRTPTQVAVPSQMTIAERHTSPSAESLQVATGTLSTPLRELLCFAVLDSGSITFSPRRTAYRLLLKRLQAAATLVSRSSWPFHLTLTALIMGTHVQVLTVAFASLLTAERIDDGAVVTDMIQSSIIGIMQCE